MKRKVSLMLAMLLTICSYTFCQKLPTMYVPETISEKMISEFISGSLSKFKKIKVKLPNTTASFIYTTSEMNVLLSKVDATDGFRVYFAAYNGCINSTAIPSTVKKDKIILLFSPGFKDRKPEKEVFYFIDENDNIDSVYNVTDLDCVQQWINNYKNDAIQNILRTTLINNDTDNIDPKIPGKYFDTKSVFFNKDSLYEAITKEQTYTHTLNTNRNVNIDFFRFSIAAFDNVGQFPPDQAGHRWRKRILLMIDYMYKEGTQKKVLQFEDLINFDDRLTQTVVVTADFTEEKAKSLSRKEKLKILGIKAVDKGQLCPTNCP